jgi:hypothetical protein
VFLLSPKSCTNLSSDSGDQELDLGELTYLTGELTGLTDLEALWALPRVNILVSSLFSRVAVVSSLGKFGAR